MATAKVCGLWRWTINPISDKILLKVPGFIMYGPVIMMMQALVLIAVEKIWMIFPRLSQKLERFYKSVVEEALLGKDPDVAEDFSGGALSMDKVVRERQREEICGALRGSSLFYHMYIFKNIVFSGIISHNTF